MPEREECLRHDPWNQQIEGQDMDKERETEIETVTRLGQRRAPVELFNGYCVAVVAANVLSKTQPGSGWNVLMVNKRHSCRAPNQRSFSWSWSLVSVA
jgi:hypothetical protein